MNDLTPTCPECHSHDVLYIRSVIGGVCECRYRCYACGDETPGCATAQEADGYMRWVARPESERSATVMPRATRLPDRRHSAYLLIAVACLALGASLIWLRLGLP